VHFTEVLGTLHIGHLSCSKAGTLSLQRLLIVEPETMLRLKLRDAVTQLTVVDADSGVPTARHRLLLTSYNWLVTNIRLEAYNGLHLAYLARMAPTPPQILVYGDETDLLLAREAQQIGAFYEYRSSIADSLPGYLTSLLPPNDRRDAAVRDRRTLFRGGRRSGDLEPLKKPGSLSSAVTPRLSAVRTQRER
jgi:hypothetical protein